MLLNGKCRFIFQIVISILCSPVILVEYLLVSCKSKGLLHTAFSILCAPICLLQYLLVVVLKNSKSHQKRLPLEKQKTLLMTGASIQGMYIFLLKHLFIRHIVGSTDQACSSGLYFRIAWKSMEQPCFLQNNSLSFLQGLRSTNIK